MSASPSLLFDLSIPKFLAARSVGRVSDWFLFGPLSALSLAKLEPRALPGPRWVRLAPLASGICGSDLSLLGFEGSPALEPFASFPAVLGHEVVGRVVEVGAEVEGFAVGDRVVMDPTLSCAARGFEPACASCAAGFPGTCARMGDAGRLARGMLVGAHKDLPGGWGPEVLCHATQLHRVPDALSDETAALCEPLSVGLHAVLQTPLDGDAALVIGSGPIALGTIWALRAAGFEGTILSQTKRPHEAALAKRFGASECVSPTGTRDALLATGARAYKPMIGDEVYAGGGFPLVFDCVGSAQSLAQALRYVAPRGRIVLLGCAATLRELDLSFLWAREITLQGFLCYGREKDGTHTFDVTLRKLVETGTPVADMITHRFPIARYREALSACTNRAKSGAVKVLFVP
jgi:threonine dehydrogenase-like Zn-dependent dehydrogenase